MILAVVDRSANNIYCLCLNDYLEKVLIPDEPNYMEQDTKTIYIPIENNLKDMGTSMIEWYGKRAKLYAFFNKIHSQAEDLKYCSAYDLEDEVRHFLSIILRSDVWSACDYFPALKYARGEIDYYVEHGITREAENLLLYGRFFLIGHGYFIFSLQISLIVFWANASKASRTGSCVLSGAKRAIGLPLSPLSAMLCTSGISPSSGIFISSARRRHPPLPKM